MSGKNCKKPPEPEPPELIDPDEYWTPAATDIPVTAISSICKESPDVYRADCATAFADAYSAWAANESAGTPPYETACVGCEAFQVGANVRCCVFSSDPTYTVDFSDYITTSQSYALDKIVACFDWDYGHDNSPWNLIFEFGQVQYEIEAGIAEITVATPDSLDSPGEIKIIQNGAMPPAPCPPPVQRYTMIHEIWKLKAYWKPQLLSTYNLDDNPPPVPFSLTLDGPNSGPSIISPQANVTEGP